MFIRKVCAGSQSSLALTSTGQVDLEPSPHAFLFFLCWPVWKCMLTQPTVLLSGVCVGLRRLPRLRLLRGHGAQAQTDRGDVHYPRGGHLHWGQSLPGSVPRYGTSLEMRQFPFSQMFSFSICIDQGGANFFDWGHLDCEIWRMDECVLMTHLRGGKKYII